MRAPAVFGLVLIVGCDRHPMREPSLGALAAPRAVVDPTCRSEASKPASSAPAEGLWAYRDSATSHRVAAMIGPAQSVEGSTHITRAVETLESRPGHGRIRHATDTASVQLEFIPPFTHPAAVYSIDRRVILAAYEPCGPSTAQPLIRYLRRDALGYVATDVMLQREARP